MPTDAAPFDTFGVFKCSARLRTPLTIPSSPSYGTTQVLIEVDDYETLGHVQLFAGNDILLIEKSGARTWFNVQVVVDMGDYWKYGIVIMAGSSNVSYPSGLEVVDYGLSGDTFVLLARGDDDTAIPQLQVNTHDSAFTSLDANGTLKVGRLAQQSVSRIENSVFHVIAARQFLGVDDGTTNLLLQTKNDLGLEANIQIRKHDNGATEANRGVIQFGGMDGQLGGMVITNFTSPVDPAPSAALEIRTTTGGFLGARLTQTQIDALDHEEGLEVYNLSTHKKQIRTNIAWVDLH